MAQTSFILLRVLQDLQTQSHQFFLLDFFFPGFLGRQGLLFFVEAEKPFCFALDTFFHFLFDFAGVVFWFRRRRKKEFCKLLFLVGEDLIGCEGGLFVDWIFKFLIRDIEGIVYKLSGELAMSSAVVGEFEEMRSNLR